MITLDNFIDISDNWPSTPPITRAPYSKNNGLPLTKANAYIYLYVIFVKHGSVSPFILYHFLANFIEKKN